MYLQGPKGRGTMTRKLFSEEEIDELRASPYVESVTSRCVIFTPEFKKKAYAELASKGMREIFEDYGINTAALGESRIYGFREKLEIVGKRKEGFSNMRKQRKERTNASIEDRLERKVKQLEHQLAYAQQEIEFLKKIQLIDMEARKKCTTKHRQK